MASSPEHGGSEDVTKAPAQRRRLHLKPRDPQAAAKKEEERLRGSHSGSLFGDAKPREMVIADRVGKSEEDVLKEEVKKEKLHLRLTPEQNLERVSHEAAVKEVQQQIDGEPDEKKRDLLQVERDARQKKLDELMEQFVHVTLEHAKSGEAPRMSQLRKMQQEQVPVPPGYTTGPPVVQQPVYSNRYNPTQQYHQNNQGRGGYAHGGRGGHTAHGRGYYNNNNTNINTSSGMTTRGGRGGGGMQRGRGYHGNPAQQGQDWEEFSPEMGDIDGTLYETPNRQYAGRGGRQGRQQHPGGMQRQMPTSLTSDAFYQGPYPGRGVGGEIEFDSFTGQDRY